jgi:hypothetical protein
MLSNNIDEMVKLNIHYLRVYLFIRTKKKSLEVKVVILVDVTFTS